MDSISVIIVARNEANKLDSCLSSIPTDFSRDTIVIDLESTDHTKEVAKKHKAKLVSHKPNFSIVEEIREESLELAKNEYVLILDPDESITKDLATALKKIVIDGRIAAVSIPRKNMVFGKWIKNSRWWPDHQVRLVKKSRTKWPKHIHSKPIIDGETKVLEPTEELSIIHNNYENIDEFIEKNMRYAKSDALISLNSKEKLTLSLTIKRSVSEFVSRFFMDHGYRDGMHGFVLAFLQLIYYFLVYFYYWEAKKYQNLETDKELLYSPKELFRHGYKEVIYWTNKEGKKSIRDKIIRKVL